MGLRPRGVPQFGGDDLAAVLGGKSLDVFCDLLRHRVLRAPPLPAPMNVPAPSSSTTISRSFRMGFTYSTVNAAIHCGRMARVRMSGVRWMPADRTVIMDNCGTPYSGTIDSSTCESRPSCA